MRKADINDVVFLENNRIIYAGVKSLYTLWKNKYSPPKKLEHAKKTIEDTIRQQWEACFPKKEISFGAADNPIRYQNPHNRFFRFLHGEQIGYISHDDDRVRACQDEAANMVQLYNIISELQNCTAKERFPDLFESLCDCMSDIMGSQMCYLLYSQKDQTELLSMSSFPAEMISEQLKPKHYDELRTQIQQYRSRHRLYSTKKFFQWHVADTIYVPYAIDGKHLAVIVLDYPRYPKTHWKGEWVYIVFQYEEDNLKQLLTHEKENVAQSRCGLLTCARNMLFLRQDILDECITKMYILLMAQRSYQYVCPLRDDTDIHILHLTDMHLDRSNCERALDFSKKFKDNISLDVPIDLLAITGDVVQANASAGILEENYKIADEFIRSLVVSLWKKENGKIRSDWQKRILIVPGNHDYASMNELQTMFAPGMKRATAIGYPAKNEGGPMVKFAYYINFVCHLLGLDLDSLIENDLNELRCYRELGLTVFALNTVSQTGPLRTNKVMMNEEVIEQFSKTADTQEQFKLLLCHHGPQYRPNYFMDRYWFFNPKATNKQQEEWIDSFWECIKEINKNAICEEPNDILSIRSKLTGLAEEIAATAGLNINNPEKNTLLWDIVRIRDALSERSVYSEQIAALFNSLNNDYEMTTRDSRLLHNGYKKLLQQVKFQLSLSGHTHTLAHGGSNLSNANMETITPEEIPFIEGDLMFHENAISIGLVVINKKEKTIKWQMKTSPADKKSKADKEWKY